MSLLCYSIQIQHCQLQEFPEINILKKTNIFFVNRKKSSGNQTCQWKTLHLKSPLGDFRLPCLPFIIVGHEVEPYTAANEHCMYIYIYTKIYGVYYIYILFYNRYVYISIDCTLRALTDFTNTIMCVVRLIKDGCPIHSCLDQALLKGRLKPLVT